MFAYLAAAITALFLTAAPVQARDHHAAGLRIDHPTARPTKPGQPSAVAYVTIDNRGKRRDRLLGAGSPIAKTAQIHSMVMNGDVMRMREVGSVNIQPGTTIVMQPGDGYHIMLFDLKRPLKAGDRFPLTLSFEKAGQIQVSVKVEEPGGSAGQAQTDADVHQHHH